MRSLQLEPRCGGLAGCYLKHWLFPGRLPMTRLRRNPVAEGGPARQKGAMGYVLAWLLGVPIPILIIVALLRGCS
jgi:hypothetical protein